MKKNVDVDRIKHKMTHAKMECKINYSNKGDNG